MVLSSNQERKIIKAIYNNCSTNRFGVEQLGINIDKEKLLDEINNIIDPERKTEE